LALAVTARELQRAGGWDDTSKEDDEEDIKEAKPAGRRRRVKFLKTGGE